ARLAGRDEAGPAYLAILERAYARYLDELRACYAAEARWPDQPFWRRRQARMFTEEPVVVEEPILRAPS
ncbi:MAG: hypothetical protein M3Q65_22905, partial [Chloroflexota bacterium]|nr:hypothetical protein [Chloroflexota bacterium]